MRANVGDRIVIRGHRVGEPDRDCEVLEVRDPDGRPPYRVRWGDTGQESLFFHRPGRGGAALRPGVNLTRSREGEAMKITDVVRRSGVGIGPDRTVHEAAAIMEQAGVGALAVIEGERLVGVVTDRDLVRRALACGLPPDARVDAVMTMPVVTIDAEADLHEAFALFRSHAVRRLAVVRGEQFVGMITVDDLLMDLAADLSDLARPVTAEVLFAHHDSPVPATA